jgi:two-component system CheB/CheR fusion protein
VNAPPHPSFLILGIGASAGGLEAMEKFLAELPRDGGVACVVVQHLDPTGQDLLPELLQRVTALTVHRAQDRMRVRPGCVYVIPPNKDLTLDRGLLRLSAPAEARGLRLPIDRFLVSLAQEQGPASVGIILSGMGRDGLQGLRAIKAHGGLGLAQAPASALFPSMPQAVIDAGLADLVDPPELLATRLLARLRQPAPETETKAELETDPGMDQLMVLLRARTGQEFSLYKRSTVVRRVERRMGVHQMTSQAGYLRFLEQNPGELDLLFKELLIGVTRFFRDPAVWQALADRAFPELFKGQPDGREFRAWVPGCSTGEEAYGLAMVFREARERIAPQAGFSLQIFATDLDRDAIARARTGRFRPDIADDVSAERLERCFVPDPEGFRVRREIRDMVVFAPQNLIMDPPFTRLDLLSCRNLLIYLAPALQKKLMALFHYSLVRGGLLCLGSSESPGLGLFTPLEAKCRLFRRSDVLLPIQDLAFPPAIASARSGVFKEPQMVETAPNLAALADQVLLQHCAPPAVLVNEAGDIVYVSGRTGKYLEPAAGKANWNLFAMAREGLRLDLASALHRAMHQEDPVLTRELQVDRSPGAQTLVIKVQKLLAPSQLRGLLMVVFLDQPALAAGARRRARGGPGQLAELQQELAETRQELLGLQQEMQTSQEELKSANEELQSTNEELQSTNEELQSTNEELTTSKEEMQSLNEELQTVNAEQQARMEDLARTGSDMRNLLDATDVAAVFLDSGLRVGRFTSGTSRLYKLLPGDVGRPLSDIATGLHYPELADDAREVLRTLIPCARNLAAADGCWYWVRIMPYRTPDDRIDGVVITFTDTTQATRLETELRGTAGQLQALLDRMRPGYVLCDLLRDPAGRPIDGRVLQANRAFLRQLGAGTQPVLGLPLSRLLPPLGALCARVLAELPATGEPVVFAEYLKLETGVMEFSAYRSAPEQFVGILRDPMTPGGLLQAPE